MTAMPRGSPGELVQILQEFGAEIAASAMADSPRDPMPAEVARAGLEQASPSPHLLSDALGARIFVSTERWGTQATLAVTRAVTETERGWLVMAWLSHPWRVSERLMIAPGLGVTWADENYMVSYFGVDASEAARSGFSEYRPGAGFKDASFRIRARYRISERVSVVGAAGVIHLLDEAADAPLTDEDTQAIAVVGFVYRF